MRRNRNLASLFLTIGLIVAASMVIFSILNSSPTDARRFLSFNVEAGESFGSIAARLKDEGLVRSYDFFYYVGRLTGKSGKLKAGEYELNTLMTSWEILNVVTGSSVKLHRFTILEGATMFQVAQALDDAGLVDRLQFLEAAWDRSFVEELNIPSFTVEGYLFPETYYLSRGQSVKSIIRTFVDMFWSKIPEDYLEKAKKTSLSFHEAVILASVIEKETGLAAEMGVISSVFHNRMTKGMKLQSDPTAVYDLLPYGGRVTRDHLFRKTPFNTYQNQGIPLTPICNPSLLAIHSAIYPQKTEYIFFVSRRDGSHHFSKTYDEHKAAIKRFLK